MRAPRLSPAYKHKNTSKKGVKKKALENTGKREGTE